MIKRRFTASKKFEFERPAQLGNVVILEALVPFQGENAEPPTLSVQHPMKRQQIADTLLFLIMKHVPFAPDSSSAKGVITILYLEIVVIGRVRPSGQLAIAFIK
jgi:hypothetical protein